VFADRKFAVIRELQDNNKKILMMRVSQLVASSAASPRAVRF
jgi:hypothetical protein